MTSRPGAVLALSLLLTMPLGQAWATPSEAPPSDVEPGEAGPGLTAPEPRHDFGQLFKGDRVEHTFVLENTGSAPVAITRVVPMCGCTVADFDREIPPGGQGKVRVQLDSLTLNGEGSTAIRVYAAGSDDPAARLEVTYDVREVLTALPGYARWNTVQGEVEGTLPQVVWATDGKPFAITTVESENPNVAVTFRPAEESEVLPDRPTPQWIVAPTLASWSPVGAVTGRLLVHTTHPDQEVMPLALSGFVRPILLVEPTNGALGEFALTETRRAVFKVRNFATEEIKVTAATVDLPGVVAEVSPVEEGRRYDIALVFDPAKVSTGEFAGELTIATDSAKVPELSVPVTGIVTPEQRASASR